MSHHRTGDDARERIHLARHPGCIFDADRDATETAYREIVAGRYRGASRSTAALNLGRDDSPDSGAVALLTAALARDAVVPDALVVACAEHEAEPGVYCYRGARGVCAERLDGRPRHG
jgi:hypothetical protein